MLEAFKFLLLYERRKTSLKQRKSGGAAEQKI